MPQLTYPLKPAIARQGMIADVGYDNVVMSRSAAAALHVGVMVIGGPNNPVLPGAGQCQEIADAAATIPLGLVGVSVLDTTRMPFTADANAKALYALGDVVPVLTRGRIWVWTEVATAVTDTVFVRVLAVGADTKGQFRKDAAANFIAAPTGWKWLTATAGAGLIQLELR